MWMKVLAALVLADREYVTSQDLARDLFTGQTSEQIRRQIRRLRRHGCQIQGKAGFRVRGFALMTVPPDDLLEGMLRAIPTVKSSRWWRELSISRERRAV